MLEKNQLDESKQAQSLMSIVPFEREKYDNISCMYAISRRGVDRALCAFERLASKCCVDMMLVFCLGCDRTMSS